MLGDLIGTVVGEDHTMDNIADEKDDIVAEVAPRDMDEVPLTVIKRIKG